MKSFCNVIFWILVMGIMTVIFCLLLAALGDYVMERSANSHRQAYEQGYKMGILDCEVVNAEARTTNNSN